MKNMIYIFGLLVLFSNLSAQHTNIRISSPEYNTPEEVTIAVNPANPLNLVAGANIRFYYYSEDGGYTWKEGFMSSTYNVAGDPCVIFDAPGNAYYGHLSNPDNGSWLDRIVVQKSIDGGKTWNTGVGVGLNGEKDQDKEWLIADMTNSPYKNNIYMAWTQFDHYGSSDPSDSTRILFSRSTDQGDTWSDPVIISDHSGNCEDSDETVEGAVPAVGPDGEVYISWSGPLGIMFDRSFDGGQTFGKDIFVTDQHGGWDIPSDSWGIYRCNGMPVTVCDISNSPHRGTIYILWSDDRNGDYDIFVTKSTDRGSTWSEPKKVNDDNSGRVQFFGWITVDPVTGAVYVIFYDRRETTGNATDVYVAKSYDGCETFTNFRISESSFVPDSRKFFGDYINITAYNGYVHPIWMRLDSLDLSVWTAVIYDTSAVTGIKKSSSLKSFRLEQNYPNPFNPETYIRYQLAEHANIKISIFTLLGREIKTLFTGQKEAGYHTIQWDGTDNYGKPAASGQYFYRLVAKSDKDYFVQVKKMVLVH